ncbi:hypothetical protein CP556_22550 [Natrinema sp. CBA1119]|nr:hypothetical protein CP556_22550 [Natrinema sp. CBA1119]
MTDSTEQYGVVEDNGDVYLTRTADATFSTGSSLDEMFVFLHKAFLFGLYSIFLILFTTFHYHTHPNRVLSFAKGGFGIVVASFIYPYVMMFTSLPFAFGAIVLWFVTLGLVLFGSTELYMKRKKSDRDGQPSR